MVLGELKLLLDRKAQKMQFYVIALLSPFPFLGLFVWYIKNLITWKDSTSVIFMSMNNPKARASNLSKAFFSKMILDPEQMYSGK